MKMAWCAAKGVVQKDNGKGKLAQRASNPYKKKLVFSCFIHDDQKLVHKDWVFINVSNKPLVLFIYLFL